MDKSTQALIKNFLLELYFPSFCLGCQKEGFLLCEDCRATLEISEYNYCLCNKNPLRIPRGGKCQRCQDKKLAGLYFALPYQEKFLTKKLIYHFKYRHLKTLAKSLAGVVMEHMIIAKNDAQVIWENSVLVAVPMELRKQKSRGYNQAEELAKELAKIVKIPVVSESLIKIRSTAAQMELSAKERQENAKGAFAIKNPG